MILVIHGKRVYVDIPRNTKPAIPEPYLSGASCQFCFRLPDLSIVIVQRQARGDRTLLRTRIEIVPHLNSRDLVLRNRKPTLFTRRASYILQLEHFLERSSERAPHQPRPEAEMQAMPKQDVILEGTVRVQLLGLGEGKGIHCRFGSGDENGVAGRDEDRTPDPIVHGNISSRNTWQARNDTGVAHSFHDEALQLPLGSRVVLVRELDDAVLVDLVPGAKEEVNEQRRLLRDVSSNRRAHANAVTDLVTHRQSCLIESVVDAVGVGSDFERAALGKPVHYVLLESLLRLEVGFEDLAQRVGGLEGTLAELPLVCGDDVEALVHEENEIRRECVVDGQEPARVFFGLERERESIGEPQDGTDVGYIANDVDGFATLLESERVVLDQLPDVDAEPFGCVLFEVVFEEDFVQHFGSGIVPVLFIPTDHDCAGLATLRARNISAH